MPSLTVVVLNCGYTSPVITKARGQYSDVFADILRPAVARHNARAANANANTHAGVELVLRGYDAIQQTYPPSLDGVDALIITGSPNGAYEDFAWIRTLLAYVRRVYTQHPAVKIYGSCFGHQVVCAALFCEAGAVVCKDPNGFELGVQTVALVDAFAARFAPCLGGKRALRLQMLHGDHVVLPDASVPDGTCVIGTTPHCANQGIYQAGRLLTYQGHPEFDTFMNTECLKIVGPRKGWSDAATAAAIASAQGEDDAATATDIIVSFFLGEDTGL
ncbi:hypothetical protein SCUCBS95973_005070 [Sporothrix curviconia]|uniref:Glutamine amidotransferase domain-containing protein n=1 Tax=Sporothrix curviconia TaxID=1260050 RepID=A0ABP0BU75_9PEZI